MCIVSKAIVKNVFLKYEISCSLKLGKEKSVKTAMERYFRIDKRIWIKSQPGIHILYRRVYDAVIIP